MKIGKESKPQEVPLPVHPDDVPQEQPTPSPVTTPAPEKVPAGRIYAR